LLEIQVSCLAAESAQPAGILRPSPTRSRSPGPSQPAGHVRVVPARRKCEFAGLL